MMSVKRWGRCAVPVMVLLCGMLLTGCHAGGVETPSSTWNVEPATATVTDSTEPSEPVLRILVAYSPMMANHAALWVGSPSDGWVIWDPGAWFDENEVFDGYSRERDLITGKIPSLENYWQMRLQSADGVGLKVFEWQLSNEKAKRLYNILMYNYETDVDPGRCGTAISGFIEKYGPPKPPGPLCDWLPDCIADHFWEENPSRVIVFSDDDVAKVYSR